MAYDYSKLIGKIIEKFGTRGKFAVEMKMSERSLSLKLNGKIDFRQDEIAEAAVLLDIPATEIHEHFFTLKVQ